MSARPVRVLFVCLGNICRSPTAHGVFRELVQRAGLADRIEIDSAGTIGFHEGRPPDARAQAAAQRRGVDLSDLRARQVAPEDFVLFDYLLAMDDENRRALMSQASPEGRDRIRLFLDFARDPIDALEVPDPYYGGGDGFERVLDLCEAGARGLLEHLRGTDFAHQRAPDADRS